MSETYPQPHLGQVFFRYPNQDKTQRDFGQCVSFVERGIVRGEMQWSATISDGRGGVEQISPRSVMGTAGWRPLPQEELETRYGPGYRALQEQIAKLGEAAQTADELLAYAVEELRAKVAALEAARKDDQERLLRLAERLAALEKVADRKAPDPAPPSPTKPLRTVDAGAAASR